MARPHRRPRHPANRSRRLDAYRDAVDQLRRHGHIFPCSCSRTTAARCRCTSGARWRVRFPPDDFTVLRADGIFTYQLAVVVDDAFQGVTDVVRGADLLDSTPCQMHLQKLLGYPSPTYRHIPVVVNEKGEKLSKQTLAPPLDAHAVPDLLSLALLFLGYKVPTDLSHSGPHSILRHALRQ